MISFFNTFMKTSGFLIAIILVFFLTGITLNYFNKEEKNSYFKIIEGDKESKNIVSIIKLNGPIVEELPFVTELANPLIISPSRIKNLLEELEQNKTKVIIFSINSPGGTVSASKNLHDIILEFKKRNNVEIIFHSDELIASGAYWVSLSGDRIFASYGSIVGSIGVKGPDWFYYDQPKSMSTGIFGKTIETKEGIKLFSQSAGKSKNLFNPFNKPKKEELEHLNLMINDIYDDFVRAVSKKRKLESKFITNKIGALIFNSKNAKENFLIDDELSLSNLIKKIIKEKSYKNYQILENNNFNNFSISNLLRGYTNNSNSYNQKNIYFCSSMRSKFIAILNYESIGC